MNNNVKNILITGIGGLTPRSIARIIRENHPDYRLIGCDIEKKAVGFFMKDLLDEYNFEVIKFTLESNVYRSDLNIIDGNFEEKEKQLYSKKPTPMNAMFINYKLKISEIVSESEKYCLNFSRLGVGV